VTLSLQIKAKARELGFAKCGITRARPLNADCSQRFHQWLDQQHHGEMSYMARAPERRLNPELVLGGAHTLISVLVNYYSPEDQDTRAHSGRISRYGWGRDYHDTVREKLFQLRDYVSTLGPGHSSLSYVDTGPVLDKWWAERAGLGWTGKSSNLITREMGSWVFVGEILSTLPLGEGEYDSPFEHLSPSRSESPQEKRTYCGSCSRCLTACPTGAIVAPFIVDARLCISYLTIELRGPIPRHLRPLIGNRIFGCDDCQEVCPWNRFAVPTDEPDFRPREGNLHPHLIDLLLLGRDEFNARFKESPIRRATYPGFLRNVAVALGNSHDTSVVPVLAQSLSHEVPVVRLHVAWALGKLGTERAVSALREQCEKEKELQVLEEIHWALGGRSVGSQ
jgi:epoxyqueuosine reductase